MAKAAAVASQHTDGAERDFYQGKVRSALFYAEQVLPTVFGLARVVANGSDSVVETDAALV